jgi:hypothetical protein
MKRLIMLAALLGSALCAFVQPAAATWVTSNCNGGTSSDSNVKRSEAQAYSAVGDNEGYEWGGGCWNDNNRDDTPNAPDSSGEGPDCSGFTFKTWEMKSTYGESGFTYYSKLKNIHGPYHAATFHDVGTSSTGVPFFKLGDKNRSTTLYMDAFASSGHIGMLYTSSYPSSGGDYIIEALGDAYGIDINDEDYRARSEYNAVRRKSWTSDCYPNCTILRPRHVVVV